MTNTIQTIKSSFLIGFIYFHEDGTEEYFEKYFDHLHGSNVNMKSLEIYLTRKYEKIIATENNLDIDALCISHFEKIL